MPFNLNGFNFNRFVVDSQGRVINTWADIINRANLGIFLLNFSSEETKLEVLYGPFILKAWSEDEDYKCGSVLALPVWARLYRIMAHIADPRILSLLCSCLGKTICTDGVTADDLSYNFARVCVEVYADAELKDYIEYQDPYRNCFVQPMMYEWRHSRSIEDTRENGVQTKNKVKVDNIDKELVEESQEVAVNGDNQTGAEQEVDDLCSIVPDTQKEIGVMETTADGRRVEE
ncbi:hypothetical protein QQ045_006520 [Rhodiola kirilowii]